MDPLATPSLVCSAAVLAVEVVEVRRVEGVAAVFAEASADADWSLAVDEVSVACEVRPPVVCVKSPSKDSARSD